MKKMLDNTTITTNTVITTTQAIEAKKAIRAFRKAMKAAKTKAKADAKALAHAQHLAHLKAKADAKTNNPIDLEQAKKARATARGQATKARKAYTNACERLEAAKKAMKATRAKLTKSFGPKKAELQAELAKLQAEMDETTKAFLEAYGKVAKANEARKVAEGVVIDAEAKAMVTVTIVRPGVGTEAIELPDETIARTEANRIIREAREKDEAMKVTLTQTYTGKVLTWAVSVGGAIATDSDSAAALARMVERANPASGSMPSTQKGNYPDWAVSTMMDGHLVSTITYVTQEEAEADYAEAVEDGFDATMFHNMVVVKTTDPIYAKEGVEPIPMNVYAMVDGVLVKVGIIPTWSETAREAQRRGFILAKYEAAIDDHRPDAGDNRDAHEHLVRCGAIINGIHMAILGLTSPNAGKDGNMVLCPVEHVLEMRAWASANARAEWAVLPSKGFAYEALGGARLHYINKLGFDQVDFLVDLVAEAMATYVVVNATSTRGNLKAITGLLTQKVTDGVSVLDVDTALATMKANGATAEELAQAKKLLTSGTIRLGALTKGSTVALVNGGLKRFAEAIGVSGYMPKAFTCAASVGKFALGENGSHLTLDDWRRENETLGRKMGYVNFAHSSNPEPKPLSTQGVRALIGSEQSVFDALCDREESYIKWLTTTVEGAASLFPEPLRSAIMANPGLLRKKGFLAHIAQQVEKIEERARQGRFHGLVYNFQAAPDIFRWLYKQLTGEDKIFIPAGVAIIRGAKWFVNGQKAIATRSPIRGRSAMYEVRLYNSFAAAGVPYGDLLDAITAEEGVCFVSSDDAMMTALEMDFDGDHIQIITEPIIVDAVAVLNRRFGKPVLTVADLPSGDKKLLTKENRQAYLRSRTKPVGVGQPDNLMTKVMSAVAIGDPLTEDIEETRHLVEFLIQARVDSGKGTELETDPTKEDEACKAAASMPLPLGLAITQAERRGLPYPEDKDGEPRTDWDPTNVFDWIRIRMTRFTMGVDPVTGEKVGEAVRPAYKVANDLCAYEFLLADAALNADIFSLTERPRYGFVKEGEDAWSSTLPVDTEDEAKAARQLAIDNGMSGFAEERGKGIRAYRFVVFHDLEGKATVYDTEGNVVSGKWLCREAESGLFHILEAKMRQEWQVLMETEAGKKMASEFMVNRAAMARKSIEAYASLYGYSLRDAYNRIVKSLFQPVDEAGIGYEPSWYTYQWFITVFRSEFIEAMDDGGTFGDEAPVIADRVITWDDGESDPMDFDPDDFVI